MSREQTIRVLAAASLAGWLLAGVACSARLPVAANGPGAFPTGMAAWSTFAMPAGAGLPESPVEGRLRLQAGAATGFVVLRDSFDLASRADLALRRLPPFDFEFVQVGRNVVPVRRGSIRSEHPYWEWVLEPGLAWRDPADGRWTRVVLPFALMERNANCVHYGLLALRLRAGHASQARWQVAGETCAYLAFDAWGSGTAAFEPHPVPAAATIRAAYMAEQGSRLPLRPLLELAGAHPGADPADFGNPADVAPGDMTAFGLVVDGVHYAGGCDTRAGPYPFCDTLALPSYSLAKSLVAGLGLARLEARYPGAADTRIDALVPECSAAGWSGVSIRDAVDMATGRYDSAVPDADEDAALLSELFLAEDHEAKIRDACGRYPRRDPPGVRFAYHTSDTYIAVTAMNVLLRRRGGVHLDIYRDLVVADLWKPLDLSPVTHETRRTRDAAAQPFGGWGLLLQRDDVAKLGRWLAAGNGSIRGESLLDASLFRSALRPEEAGPGRATGRPGLYYRGGFWTLDAASFVGCDRPVWVPFMKGYGGIVVALFPNGIAYYHFSDGGAWRWRSAIRGVDSFRPLCTD